MATIVLQAAGAALGGLFGPVGAILGRAAGALAGNLIDRSLISGMTTVEGTPLSGARIAGAEEGTAINRAYGTVRIGGTLIWATRFEEEVTKERSGSKSTGPRVETFSYFANFAVGICEGPIAGIRRIWADGRELDQTGIEMRVYRGTEHQPPDPLIEAKQGTGKAPAYRGLAYVVFERLPLDIFGNRIPLLQFEVLRTVGELESQIRAVTLIPGSTEHGYSPAKVTEETGEGEARIVNRNQLRAATDWDASIDELLAVCPNLERVALVVSWFGNDLRAGHCRIRPGVDARTRSGESVPWRVGGIERSAAYLVSSSSGAPAYGGTPDDASVVAAIRDLRDRGVEVYLYPFVMMDVPDGNELPDPYGGDQQASYPWRGRITCHPAPGRPGSPDGSAGVDAQIAGFTGSAMAADFEVVGDSVHYDGEDEGYRRMILHYALLAQAAGGVDGFIIGSELRGLTQLRDGANHFPFVQDLVTLTADVRSILGASTKLTYGADWSEYFGYHPDDGSGDVFFHLDLLWASPHIDAVGIDNYMPLADFRDEDLTAQQPDGMRTADDPAAMRRALTSGEGFDWYYASDADRRARVRTAIDDDPAGKPWIWRYKDIEGWWSHRHYNRTGGAESAVPTAWTAKMKPIWFTELGCPAVDRGANQPNVFVDAKSAESALPYFSNGRRSDEMQRRFLDAHFGWWSSADAPADMVDPGHMFVWTWDARAWPAFPENETLYADGVNWARGHWLNGRMGAGTLASILKRILADYGIDEVDVDRVSGDLKGYVAGSVTSPRSLVEPLLAAFQLDAWESGGRLIFRSRGEASAPAAQLAVFVDEYEGPRWTETIGHEGDFAAEAVLDFQGEDNEYETQSLRSRRLDNANDRLLRLSLPGVLSGQSASQICEEMLRDHQLSRRQLAFSLSPADMVFEPGDVVSLEEGPSGRFLITRIMDGAARRVEARAAGSGGRAVEDARPARRKTGREGGHGFSPLVHLMDLPRYQDGDGTDFSRAAALGKPWRRLALSVSPEGEGFERRTVLTRPARIGTLTEMLAPGVASRIDENGALRVRMLFGGLSSVSRNAMLNGANRVAVRAESGLWEVIGFSKAEEESADRWRLTGLLRGLGGTEDVMAEGLQEGAPLVVLDEGAAEIGLHLDEAGLALNWMIEGFGSAGGRKGPISFRGGIRAETPLSPVHLALDRPAGGTLDFSWVRRSRIGADSWDGEDVPLDEDREAYRVDFLVDGAIVRTAWVSEPQFAYTEPMQSADFSTLPDWVTLRVRQRGSRVALGIAAQKSFRL